MRNFKGGSLASWTDKGRPRIRFLECQLNRSLGPQPSTGLGWVEESHGSAVTFAGDLGRV